MKRGYRVAFHFDPIIRFPGWEEGYTEVVTELLGKIPAAKIAWISLGSLRFPSQLKTIIQQRFPETNLIYEEFIPGVDGKFRYFKPIRVELYKKLVTLIQKDMGDAVPLYFCMESQEIWREVLKKEPRGKEEVGKFLSSPLGCCQ
jgi:spore photoproduct lyase